MIWLWFGYGYGYSLAVCLGSIRLSVVCNVLQLRVDNYVPDMFLSAAPFA